MTRRPSSAVLPGRVPGGLARRRLRAASATRPGWAPPARPGRRGVGEVPSRPIPRPATPAIRDARRASSRCGSGATSDRCGRRPPEDLVDRTALLPTGWSALVRESWATEADPRPRTRPRRPGGSPGATSPPVGPTGAAASAAGTRSRDRRMTSWPGPRHRPDEARRGGEHAAVSRRLSASRAPREGHGRSWKGSRADLDPFPRA